MSKKLFIFPCAGNGIEALDCVTKEYEMIGFIDDNKEKQETRVLNYPVYSREILNKYPEAYLMAVIGNPYNYRTRESIISSFGLETKRFASLIHPKATISINASIGINTLVMAGVVVTSNASIGSHVVILPNSVIHHDSIVGDYSIIGSNVVISGHTIVDKNCFIASGSNVINGIHLGTQALIGFGSNVIKSVEGKAIVMGNPAKEKGK
jgi:sugar O-acyltransferase (sialic acid O-acetyltransferase NeuD family)